MVFWRQTTLDRPGDTYKLSNSKQLSKIEFKFAVFSRIKIFNFKIVGTINGQYFYKIPNIYNSTANRKFQPHRGNRVNPWLHFGTLVHNPISARFRDHSTLNSAHTKKKLVNVFLSIVNEIFHI